MGETYKERQRIGLRSSVVGEIVEVEGGHIIRSTGRKDRHSKVCTAKGPRDRRVRLSAHTAIQFYDVQDRLGCDRPSKAVDWLIKKAKTAIDELAQLPAWNPTTTVFEESSNVEEQEGGVKKQSHEDLVQNKRKQVDFEHRGMLNSLDGNEGQRLNLGSNDGNPSGSSSSFLPPAMDSDSIADSIKSFFPMGASNQANSSAMQFQDLLSTTSSQSQDLRLTLQSFQDPMLLDHHHSQQSQHTTVHSEQDQLHGQAEGAFFSGNNTPNCDNTGWSEHHQQAAELGRYQRFLSWNSGGDTGSAGGGGTASGGGYLLSGTPPGTSLLQPFFGQNQSFSQRGPLQSSISPSIRAWMDPSAITIASADCSQQHQAMLLNYMPSISGVGFPSNVGGFSGLRVPARIQCNEEDQDGIYEKTSSASSDSHC